MRYKAQGCAFFKDKSMDARRHSMNIRSGRFLWMEEQAKNRYLSMLKKRILEGYFSSDHILMSLVDEIAPVFNDFLDNDSLAGDKHTLVSR
jgi:hypothetical protein